MLCDKKANTSEGIIKKNAAWTVNAILVIFTDWFNSPKCPLREIIKVVNIIALLIAPTIIKYDLNYIWKAGIVAALIIIVAAIAIFAPKKESKAEELVPEIAKAK